MCQDISQFKVIRCESLLQNKPLPLPPPTRFKRRMPRVHRENSLCDDLGGHIVLVVLCLSVLWLICALLRTLGAADAATAVAYVGMPLIAGLIGSNALYLMYIQMGEAIEWFIMQ